MAHTTQNYDQKLWEKASFPNKVKDDEDIVFIVREDLVVVFARAVGYFLVFFVMLLVRVILVGFADDTGMALFDSIFYTLNIALLTAFTLYFHNYYLSMQVVTSDRVIDIDQKGLFLREVNEMPIENIEDVTYKQNGFWGTIYNFGNVIIQSASNGGDPGNHKEDKVNGFVFNNVPSPSQIAHQLSTLREANKSNEMKEQSEYHAKAMTEGGVHYGE